MTKQDHQEECCCNCEAKGKFGAGNVEIKEHHCLRPNCPCHPQPEEWWMPEYLKIQKALNLREETVSGVDEQGMVLNLIRKVAATVERQTAEKRQKLFEENNIPHLITQMREDAEEYGQLHNDDCAVNGENECDCENMELIKSFASEWMSKVNEWWVFHATEHRKYCTPEGNKKLTKMMGKKNRTTKDSSPSPETLSDSQEHNE